MMYSCPLRLYCGNSKYHKKILLSLYDKLTVLRYDLSNFFNLTMNFIERFFRFCTSKSSATVWYSMYTFSISTLWTWISEIVTDYISENISTHESVPYFDFTEKSLNASREHNFWIREFKTFIYTLLIYRLLKIIIIT